MTTERHKTTTKRRKTTTERHKTMQNSYKDNGPQNDYKYAKQLQRDKKRTQNKYGYTQNDHKEKQNDYNAESGGSFVCLYPRTHCLIIHPCLVPSFIVSFLVSFFLFVSLLLSSYLITSLCAICLPSVSPVTPQTVLVKDGGDHRGFLSIWPRHALHLPLTAWSITHKCFLLLFGSRLLAHGSTRLSPPLSLLLWASLCWEYANIFAFCQYLLFFHLL